MRARDREDGDGDGGEDQGNHDDKPDSGNDDRDGPNEDDKNDDDDPDDGRNGGADKVATDADLAQEDVVNSPVLSGDTASSELPLKDGQRPTDLQTPNASPQRASFIMNGSAIEFVPSVRPKRPVPPLLPHHQAYTASQQGVNFSNSSSGSASPLPKFQAYSAAKPATLSPEVSVRGSIQNQYPFPELHDSAVPMHNELPAHTPAPKAAGPAEAKNAHIQKLNEEVKRLEWRRKSGMPDLVEDEDGVAVPDVVLGKSFSLATGSLCDLTNRCPDDMYDQQVIQFLNFTPIRCARGSVWGSLNDIPDPLENLSIPSTPSGSRVNLAGVPAMDPVEENVLASSSSEQSQENILPGRTACLQPSTTLPSKANPNPNVNEEMAPTTGDDLNQKASKKNDESIEAPINEMTPQTPDFDDSGMPEADEESGNGGEWSDVEADNQAEEDEGAPMLGKYKVTRGPAPVKSSSGMPMLGKYKVTRGKTLASNTSGALKAEEESGADGEWSDLEDEEDKEDEEEDKAEEEDAADATDEEDEQEGDAMPMLGSHKVTRGFTPINNNSGIAMLGNRQVTRGPTPAKISPGTPKAEEDSGYDSQPSSPCPAPKRGLPQQSLTTALPVLQSQSPSRKPPTAPAPTTDAPPPAAQEHASDGSNPEAAHDGHPNCRPSNIFPGTENATKTHDEDVGDAFADYVREHGSGKLEDSMWADKPDAKTQAIPQKLSSPTPGEDVKSPHTPNKFDDGEVSRAPPRGPANLRGLPKPQPPPGAPTGPRGHASRDPGRERSGSGIQTLVELEDPDTAPRVRLPTPRSCGIDNPDDTPRVRLPSQPKVSQAQPAPIIPDTCPSTQGELEDDSNPQAAPLGTQDARSFDPPAKPPYRASPLRNEVRGTPARKNDGGAQHRSAASPTGMAVGGDGWSPRGNGRGGRGGQGGQRGRGVRTPQKQNSTHGPFTKTPKVTPTRPAAEEDFKILGASTRGGSGGSDGQSGPGTSPRGRGGRDGYQASRQQQGPLQTSTPNTSRATTAATNNNKNNRTPPANRGSGQGGQTTPTPKPGSARGPGSANSSFQRWQDAMAKKAVEKEG